MNSWSSSPPLTQRLRTLALDVFLEGKQPGHILCCTWSPKKILRVKCLQTNVAFFSSRDDNSPFVSNVNFSVCFATRNSPRIRPISLNGTFYVWKPPFAVCFGVCFCTRKAGICYKSLVRKYLDIKKTTNKQNNNSSNNNHQEPPDSVIWLFFSYFHICIWSVYSLVEHYCLKLYFQIPNWG